MWYRVWLITALVAVLTIPAGLLTGLFVGPVLGAVVFILGWFFLVPAIPLVTALRKTSSDSSAEDPMATLKRQYASGELDEEEFHHRVEQLLEVEAVERDNRRHTSRAEETTDDETVLGRNE